MHRSSTHPNPRDRALRALALLAVALVALVAALRLAPAAAAADGITVRDPLSFAVDPELRPQVDSTETPDRPDRAPVAAVSDSFGNKGDFIADELVVVTNDERELDELLARRHGEVLKTLDAARHGIDGLKRIFLVRIDPDTADPESLARNIGRLRPELRGAQYVSSKEGLGLLAAAAEEQATGVEAGINGLGYGQIVRTRTTSEAPFSGNPFTWNHLCKAGFPGAGTCAQNTKVAEAWNVLTRAGRFPLLNPVRMAILDAGFTNGDPGWPGVIAQNTTGANPNPCSGGGACPFHGHNVTSTALSLVDDSYGAAGVAGRVAAPIIEPSGDMVTTLASLYDAAGHGARIANMSFTGTLVASVAAGTGWFDTAVQGVRNSGVTLFAAAGNDAKDVDVVHCFFTCWEAEFFWPCETTGVLCVGALGTSTRVEAGFSNFGTGGLDPGNSVDLWAPGSGIRVNLDPSSPGFSTNPNGVQLVSGTSFASPFAAGVAGLILAADPALGVNAVQNILLGSAQPATITASKTNGTTQLYPDAEAAVVAALGGNAPPDIQITSPATGSSKPRGLVHAVASATDDAGPPTVTWFVDGVPFDLGPQVDLGTWFLGFGPHIVTAKASDGTFTVDDAGGGVIVTLTNNAPTVSISRPTSGQTFVIPTFIPPGSTAQNVCLVAASSDVNNNPAQLTDAQVKWTVDGSPVATGHNTYFDARALAYGSHTVTVTGTDDGGLSASASTTIDITQPAGLTSGGSTGLKPTCN
jgi:hypothetical protein